MSARVTMLFPQARAADHDPESASSAVGQLDKRLDSLNNYQDAQAAILELLDRAAASSHEWRAEAAAELVALLIFDFDGEVEQ